MSGRLNMSVARIANMILATVEEVQLTDVVRTDFKGSNRKSTKTNRSWKVDGS